MSGDFKFFKTYALNCLKEKNYVGATAGLDDLNRCGGEDYLVIISTRKYQEAIKKESVFLCNFCTMVEEKTINEGEENEYIKKTEVPNRIQLSKINVIDIVIPILDQVIQKCVTMRIWICPECHEENKVDDTVQKNIEREKPYSLKVVPDCPIKELGISNRLGFHEVYENWFFNFLAEIINQEVLYRIEWKSQNEGDEMDAYKDQGDGK